MGAICVHLESYGCDGVREEALIAPPELHLLHIHGIRYVRINLLIKQTGTSVLAPGFSNLNKAI